MSCAWYVVHAYSNFEHTVSESLKERVKARRFRSQCFGEILVPTEEVVEMPTVKAQVRPQVLPGLCVVQMENGRRHLALGQRGAEGAGLHRRTSD